MHHNHPEAAERTPASRVPPRRFQSRPNLASGYSPKARELIAEASKIQADLKASRALGKTWTDGDFCKDFGGFVANVFFQLKAGTYPFPKMASAVTRMEANLAALVEHGKAWVRKKADVAMRSKIRPVGNAFIEFPEYSLIKAAIKRAQERVELRSEERLVVVVGEFRSGKTWCFDKLLEDGVSTWGVAATVSWKESFRAMLEKLHKVILGTPAVASWPCWKLEDHMLENLENQTGVLAVQELQDVSRKSLVFLKTVLNTTTMTMVWFMTPEYYRWFHRSGGDDHADRTQIIARIGDVVWMGAETAETVAALAPDLWAGVPADDERLQLIVSEANKLGAKSLLRRVSKMLSDTPGIHRPPTLGQVKVALSAYRRCVEPADLSRLGGRKVFPPTASAA